MNAQEIKDTLTTNDIIRLMEYFGADIGNEDISDHIEFRSICHDSNTHKLYYYPNTKSWHCFVCGSVDFFTVVMQEEGLDFAEAVKWVENFFNIGDVPKKVWGRDKFEPPKKEIIKKEIDLNVRLPKYEENLLNTFKDISIGQWENEGISSEVMKQFEIKFDINTNSIIIPHRDHEGNLIGVRQRNLDEYRIEKYGKYLPYTDPINGRTYKHKLSMNLYGLYQNIKNIIKRKKVIIFEAEKSVLLMNTFYPNDSIAVSVGGSVVHEYQIELLKSLGVEEVIICFDYEIRENLLIKMDKSYKKCALQFNTYVMNQLLMSKLLEESDAPIDKGVRIFEELLYEKVKYELEL